MGKVMKAIGSFFSPQMPKMPKGAEVGMRMPDPQAPAARLAARTKMEEERKRGREGTIYTRGGSGSYSNQSLGGTK